MARAPDFQKYPQEIRDSVRARYYNFEPVAEIVRSTGIPETTIWQWIKSGEWDEDRQNAISKHRKDTVAVLKKRYNAITNMALPAIHNSIATRLERIKEKPLSISEIRQLSSVVWEWYDRMRVDEGLPTEIIQSKGPLTQDEIIAILKKDKFLDMKGMTDVTNSAPIERQVHDSDGLGGSGGNMLESDSPTGSLGATDTSNEERNAGPDRLSPTRGEDKGPESPTSPDPTRGVQDPGGETGVVGSVENNVRDPFE